MTRAYVNSRVGKTQDKYQVRNQAKRRESRAERADGKARRENKMPGRLPAAREPRKAEARGQRAPDRWSREARQPGLFQDRDGLAASQQDPVL